MRQLTRFHLSHGLHLEACVALAEELGHPSLEKYRAKLDDVRARLADA